MDPPGVVPHHCGVLESLDDSDPAFIRRHLDVTSRPHLEERPGTRPDDPVPAGNIRDRALERILGARHIADRGVDGGRPGGERVGERPFVQRERPVRGMPPQRTARAPPVRVPDAPEHVDDEQVGLGAPRLRYPGSARDTRGREREARGGTEKGPPPHVYRARWFHRQHPCQRPRILPDLAREGGLPVRGLRYEAPSPATARLSTSPAPATVAASRSSQKGSQMCPSGSAKSRLYMKP